MRGLLSSVRPGVDHRGRGALEVDVEPGDAREVLACTDERDLVDELDVDAHPLAQVVMEGGEHLVEDRRGEAAALDHTERHGITLLLDHLEAPEGVVVVLEEMSEE